MKKKCFLVLLFLSVTLTINAQDFYKTPSGKKYHTAICRMVENVSSKITEQDISSLNLQPCKICKPSKNTTKNYSSFSNKAVGKSHTVQCKGRTKRGTRCKHKTSLSNGYCYQHTAQSNNTKYNSHTATTKKMYSSNSACGARTKSGGYCKRKVKGGGRCYQH